MMKDIIKVENLSKSYGELKAVSNLSLSVKKGTVFGLLGANGAGKSTAIECVLGTKTLDSGCVSILELDPKTYRKKLFQKVGVQFQEANYQENIRVNELCEVTASLYNNPADYKVLLNRFGIADKSKAPVKELSGGQKQRLFILLALISNPEVVFLDELTTGLDARARRDVWQILSRLKEQGLTILLTSHCMDEVEVLCDTICILKKGITVFYGTVLDAIIKSPHDKFEDAYLWYTDEEEIKNENL
jgi:ABC-2 type transport system ATP-binding protein